jgi:hypothetical protein
MTFFWTFCHVSSFISSSAIIVKQQTKRCCHRTLALLQSLTVPELLEGRERLWLRVIHHAESFAGIFDAFCAFFHWHDAALSGLHVVGGQTVPRWNGSSSSIRRRRSTNGRLGNTTASCHRRIILWNETAAIIVKPKAT